MSDVPPAQDKATDCDYCQRDIPYGERCWMVTDRWEGQQRFVKIACNECQIIRTADTA